MSASDLAVLYHIAPSRSSAVLWMLEEVGAPYELRCLDMKAGEQRQPEFLAVNPMGKVPALVHRGVTVTEMGAICAYLADAFPAAGLAPALDDPRRGLYYRWLFFGQVCFGAALVDRMLQRPTAAEMRGALPYGDFDTTVEVLAGALAEGPYLLGGQFTAADVTVGAALRWSLLMKAVPERPEFVRYAERLAARPALQRAQARDQALQSA